VPSQLQAEYKGESLIRVILESLIEYMGSHVTVADMNAEQLHCLAGGPRLKSESITIGKKEDSSRKEKARHALFSALVDLGLVPVLWYSLSQQRHHFLSEEFSEVHGGAGGLKLLGLLFDGNHECLLKLTEFLAQACTREKYMSLLPPLQEVFHMFEPALAFLCARHGLAPYGRAPAPAAPAAGGTAPVADASKATPDKADAPPAGTAPAGAAPAAAPAGEAATAGGKAPDAASPAPAAAAAAAAAGGGSAPATDGATGSPGAGTNGSGIATDAMVGEEEKTVVELEKVIRTYLPSIESDGLSMQFYITFWRLSLQDIFMPTEGYEKVIAQISAGIKQIEVNKLRMDRDRDNTHSRDYRALKKEGQRLQDFYGKLKEEQLAQQYNHQKVMARLKREKGTWFQTPSPGATSTFVSEMLCPRVLTSFSDALFCCHFVRLLITLKTPGFQLLDFYNSWTVMLTQSIRCCSEREAQIFGVFLREMMSYIITLRKDEATYNAEMKDNPAFYRNYYEDPTAHVVEWAHFTDIRKGHSKWEFRISKAIRLGLEAEDWMEKRNALMLLSQCYEAFPVVEKHARGVLASVEMLRDREELSDVKTLANSLIVKLKSRKDHWVDKGVPDATSGREHGRRGSDDRGRPKNPLAPQADGGSSAAAKHGENRSPRRGSADSTLPERRSRREGGEEPHGSERHDAKADVTMSQGGERPVKESRDPKDHKESKEPRESKEKTRDRTEAKAPKDPREPKEARTGEKVPKESRDAKESRAVEKDSKRVTTDRPREKEPERPQRSEKEVSGGDRKRSGTGSSAPAPATTHAPAHADERSEKRRRTDRDGYSSSGGHQARNALTAAPEPPGSSSQHYRSGNTGGSSHYDRRGSGYPSHNSGHSGGRYSSDHRRR